ncbi:MAG: hypothetical protein VW684_12535, partial [Betaproteobacteria bacterium]
MTGHYIGDWVKSSGRAAYSSYNLDMNRSTSLFVFGVSALILDPPRRARDARIEGATKLPLGASHQTQKRRYCSTMMALLYSFLLISIVGFSLSAQAAPDASQLRAGGQSLFSSPLVSNTDPTLSMSTSDTGTDGAEAEEAQDSPMSAFFSRSEPLTVAMGYSATQFIVRKTTLNSGTQIKIDGPLFSAHRLQATDENAPNHISVKLPSDIPYRIEQLAETTSLLLIVEAELRLEAVFEIEYQNIVRSPADLSPLKLPLSIRADAQSPWRRIQTEERAVIAGPATRLDITAPAFVEQRQAFDLSIRALDQFGHTSPAQPRSLDLRREGRLMGQLSSEGDSMVIRGSQTLDQRSITRFEARTPGGGLRGTSDWITVSAAPEALIWTDLSETSLKELPSVDSTRLLAFEGDDQAGSAQRLTLLKPLTVDDSAFAAQRRASAVQGGDAGPIEMAHQVAATSGGTSQISVNNANLPEADAIEQRSGLVTEPQASMNQDEPVHDFMLLDRPSGESLGEASGEKSGEGEDRTIESGRSLNNPDQAPFASRDGDSDKTEESATGSPSPRRLASSAQDSYTERKGETAPNESDPMLASGESIDESASIRAASLRGGSRDGTLLEPPDRISNDDKTINKQYVKDHSLDRIAETGAMDDDRLDGKDAATKVRYYRHWQGVEPDGEVAFLHTGSPEGAWRIARPESTTDRRWGRMRGAVIAQGTSAYPWLIDYIAQQ